MQVETLVSYILRIVYLRHNSLAKWMSQALSLMGPFLSLISMKGNPGGEMLDIDFIQDQEKDV